VTDTGRGGRARHDRPLLYAGLLVDVPATAADRHAAATVMYYGGDLAEIALALTLLATWRPEARPARPEVVRA
jgi:putative membrane protein